MMLLTALLAFLPVALATLSKRTSPAPLIKPEGTLIKDAYIVKMVDNVEPDAADRLIASMPNPVTRKYLKHFKGYSTTLDNDDLTQLRDNPEVEFVEQDSVVKSAEYIEPTLTKRSKAIPWLHWKNLRTSVIQSQPDWGLARISSKKPGVETYRYHKRAGAGTCVYVIDSGIDPTHKEFQGRAENLKSFIGSPGLDRWGHGTFIAGIIGGSFSGVAKKTKLFALKALGDYGRGTASALIEAMEFILTDAPDRSHECPKGIVVNISIGEHFSEAIVNAANSLQEAGYFVSTAAGNRKADASLYSPGAASGVCNVGATDEHDRWAPYSNYGQRVDVLAPGTKICSTMPGNTYGIKTGTSMSSAFVAGLGAYFLSLGKDARTLCSYMRKKGLKDTIDMSQCPNSGTSNVLVNNGYQLSKTLFW